MLGGCYTRICILLGRAETPSTAGRVELPKENITAGDTWAEVLKERRCDSQGRGSLYDSKAGKFKAQGDCWHFSLLQSNGRCHVLIGGAHAGITCHFCRQKKLCGEADCPRCSERNSELQCIGEHPSGSSLRLPAGAVQLRTSRPVSVEAGKSECSRCASANGRFCRACLLIRYGFKLEEVRQEMAAGTWLCPHCYEEDHPDEVRHSCQSPFSTRVRRQQLAFEWLHILWIYAGLDLQLLHLHDAPRPQAHWHRNL